VQGEREATAGKFMSGARLRSNAAACDVFSRMPYSPADRTPLLRLQTNWLERAHREESLDGLPTHPTGTIERVCPYHGDAIPALRARDVDLIFRATTIGRRACQSQK